MKSIQSPTSQIGPYKGIRYKEATTPWTVLLVEDNVDDVLLLVEAFKEIRSNCEMNQFTNGHDLFHSFRNQKKFENQLLILDLQLPGVHGIEILRTIRQDSLWKDLPVVVWTSSLSEKEMSECTALGVEGYILKPRTFYEFVETARYLHKFMASEEALPPLWVRPLGTVQMKRGGDTKVGPAEMSLVYISAVLRAALKTLETLMEKASWEKPVRLALLLKTAWVGIRAARENISEDQDLYKAIEIQTPHLSQRIQKLRSGLVSLEATLNGLLHRVDSFSEKDQPVWSDLENELKNASQLAKSLSETESDLIYENLTELPALD